MAAAEIVWRPQPGPQKALIDCAISEVLYGGARGGGKTDGVLGKYAIKAQRYGREFNAVFFRKEMPQQDDLIERAKSIYQPMGAEWGEQQKRFIFRSGGRVRFRPLENVADAEKYQGQNITDAAVEEAGNYEDSRPIDMLFGALRSVGGVPIQLILTANPGGAGHHWLRRRYVEPAPLGMKILRRRLRSGADHLYCYIPSRVSNNRILLSNDPTYVDRLCLVGSDALVKAWLEGDWNVIAGAYFDCFQTARHVIKPFTLPKHWTRFRSFDWGSASPFSVGWWAVASEQTTTAEGVTLPVGCLIKYREWYGGADNVGLKLKNPEIANGILIREDKDEGINYSVADPSIFKQDGGPSIAEDFARAHVLFRKGDNTRLAGWQQMRKRLIGDGDGHPMLVFFDTCTDSIRTLPVLQHDEVKPEDVDTDGEDHAADEGRYACMSRPWTGKAPEKPKAIDTRLPTIGEAEKMHLKQIANRSRRIG